MSKFLFETICNFIEPPYQNVAIMCTSPIMNVTVPRLIGNGGSYAILASIPTVERTVVVQQPPQQQNDGDTENAEAATTSSTTTTSRTSSGLNPKSSASANTTTTSSAALATKHAFPPASSTAQKSRLAYKPLVEGFANFLFRVANTSEFTTALHFRLARGADPKLMEEHITATVNKARYARRIYFQQGSVIGIDLSKCLANACMLEELYFQTTPSAENIMQLGSVAPNLSILYCSRGDLISSEAMIHFCEARKKLDKSGRGLHKLLIWEAPKLDATAVKAIGTLEALEILSLRRVAALNTSDTDTVNDCIKALCQLPRLRDFDLEAHLTDKALQHIGDNVPLLQKLYFYNCRGCKALTIDGGFFHLFKGLHQLREFSISEMPAAALEEIACCKTLRILKLHDCDAEDKDFACLEKLKNLQVLQLTHCDKFKPTAAGFGLVSNNLQRLVLTHCRAITPDVYQLISDKFPNLRELHVFVFAEEGVVDNVSLGHLSKLTLLEDLLLTECPGVTKKGYTMFEEKMKNMKQMSLGKMKF